MPPARPIALYAVAVSSFPFCHSLPTANLRGFSDIRKWMGKISARMPPKRLPASFCPEIPNPKPSNAPPRHAANTPLPSRSCAAMQKAKENRGREHNLRMKNVKKQTTADSFKKYPYQRAQQTSKPMTAQQKPQYAPQNNKAQTAEKPFS